MQKAIVLAVAAIPVGLGIMPMMKTYAPATQPPVVSASVAPAPAAASAQPQVPAKAAKRPAKARKEARLHTTPPAPPRDAHAQH